MFESLLLFVVVFVNSYLCSILCVYSVVAHRIYTCTQQCWHNIIIIIIFYYYYLFIFIIILQREKPTSTFITMEIALPLYIIQDIYYFY